MLDVDEQNGQTNRSHAQQVVEEDDLGAGCSVQTEHPPLTSSSEETLASSKSPRQSRQVGTISWVIALCPTSTSTLKL